jgi:hypothetical protein
VASGFIARPSSGNMTKVEASTSRCRRQWRQAGQHRFARQLGAVQEEQQADRNSA